MHTKTSSTSTLAHLLDDSRLQEMLLLLPSNRRMQLRKKKAKKELRKPKFNKKVKGLVMTIRLLLQLPVLQLLLKSH